MAGLKKKKKEPSTSPNVILVIFLVLFVLLSIGFGFWGYSGMAASAEAQNKATVAVTTAKVEKNTNKYYSMLYRDLRIALGDKIEEKEEAEWKIDRDEFMKEGFGAFKDESNKDAAKKFMAELEAKYGVDAAGKYKSNVLVELQLAQAKIKELDGKAYASITDHEKTKNLLKDLQKKQDEFHQDALDRIQKNSTLAMAASKSGRDEFAKTAALNRELNKQLKEKDDETDKLKEEYEKRLKLKDFAIRDLKKEMADAAGAVAGGAIGAGRPGGDAFPLMLDVNMGKPLWDAPVGKVVRVDLDVRQVSINLGSSHGIKPETTFNIFGANSAGRAEKQLKGSIEVIRVLDTTTSLARITSLYDAEGHEILLNLESRNKFQRENEIPIKDGDLLFNLFWGTRVAVAGYVNITGEASDNPAEQIRQMDDFMYLLRRNGMQVDAYVDLRNGQIQGNLSSKTRYLIKGDDLRVAIDKPAEPAKEADDKEKEPAKDKDAAGEKEPVKDAAGAGDRNDAINKSSVALRKDAIEKGLLLISAENFSHMIGYRRARSANSLEISGFRPSLPYAGAIEAGVIRAPERPAAEEKKEMEEKK